MTQHKPKQYLGYLMNTTMTGLLLSAAIFSAEWVENVACFLMFVVATLTMLLVVSDTQKWVEKPGGTRFAWVFHAANIMLAASMGWFATALWYALGWTAYTCRVEAARRGPAA